MKPTLTLIALLCAAALALPACSDDDGGSGNNGNTNTPPPCADDAECDDGNPCTADRCDPELGCQSDDDPAVCDDGDPCTTEACDPQSGCRTTALDCVDLRADTNRDGTVDLDDPTDDEGEETWDASHGAVLLANLDDDESACPDTGTDAELAACHDAADELVNGEDDLPDLARLRIAPWPGAPDDAFGSLHVAAPGASHVRLFVLRDGAFEPWPAPRDLTPAELRTGLELAIEATDFARDPDQWDGLVELTFAVGGGTGPHGAVPGNQDTVQLRVAPLRFPHALQPVRTIYAPNDDAGFLADLQAACTAAAVPEPVYVMPSLDRRWIGQLFHPTHTTLPGADGHHSMRVNLRVAASLGWDAPQVVYTELRGPDVAGALGYAETATAAGDTACNLIVIPPHSHAGQSWPHGRALRASTAPSGPGTLDPVFQALLEAQGLGPAVYVDASWMVFPSVTELVTFLPADSPRGWVMLIASPAVALALLEQANSAGHGDQQLFVGKLDANNVPAAVSINEVLADPDLMSWAQQTQLYLDQVQATIQTATGLTEAEILPVPALFERAYGNFLHYLPSLASGIPLSDQAYLAPDPAGPSINGEDLFKSALTDLLAPLGITPHWVDDWDTFHVLQGGLSCGLAVDRAIPTAPVWD